MDPTCKLLLQPPAIWEMHRRGGRTALPRVASPCLRSLPAELWSPISGLYPPSFTELLYASVPSTGVATATSSSPSLTPVLVLPELLSVRADPSLELLPADLPTEEDVKKWVRPSPCLPPTRVGPPQTPPRCSPPCPQTPPRRPVGLRRTTQSRESSSRLRRSCLRSWPEVEERADVLGPHMSVSGERTIRNMCVQIRFDSRPRRLEDL
jgi:hypothetical protein